MAKKQQDANKWEVLERLRYAEADLHVSLEVFGDELAKRCKYKSHRGMEAIYFWIIERHHWLPAAVRAMNSEDLRFLLEEEMSGWTMPKDVVAALGKRR